MTGKPFLPGNPGNTVISSFSWNFCTETTQELSPDHLCSPVFLQGDWNLARVGLSPEHLEGLDPPTQLGNSRDGDVLISKVSDYVHGGQQSFALFSLREHPSRGPAGFSLVPLDSFQSFSSCCWFRLPSLSFLPSLDLCLHPLLLVLLLSFRGFLQFYFEHQLHFYRVCILPVSDHCTRRGQCPCSVTCPMAGPGGPPANQSNQQTSLTNKPV